MRGNWVRITHEQFDYDPAAFHCVFLSECTAVWRQNAVCSMQGEFRMDVPMVRLLPM